MQSNLSVVFLYKTAISDDSSPPICVTDMDEICAVVKDDEQQGGKKGGSRPPKKIESPGFTIPITVPFPWYAVDYTVGLG